VGEWSPGRPYLLRGERGVGKTTFALQFLYKGLQDHQVAVLVSSQSPETIVSQAQKMGMDLSPFLKEGTLLIYEIQRKDASAAALFNELKDITAAYPASRLVIEGLAPDMAPSDAHSLWGEAMGAFLRKLESMKTTALITLEPPTVPLLSPFNAVAEELCAGVFVLKTTSEDGGKTMAVKKFLERPMSEPGEFAYRVEPGRGVVEAPRPQVRAPIKFPRHD